MDMNKLAATLGVLAVGGGLSICDLCDTSRASRLGATHEFISVASATTPGELEQAGGKESHGTPLRPAPAKKTVAFKIQGMTCGGCVFAVRKVLSRLPGVSKTDVSYEKSRAVVTYDPALATTAQMVAAIKTLGYSATVDTSPAVM